jgi:hypothetical protein
VILARAGKPIAWCLKHAYGAQSAKQRRFGATLRLRGVLEAGTAAYTLPTPPGYRAVRISQTRNRLLVEMGSAAPDRPIVFYAGTIPKRLRLARRVALAQPAPATAL